MHQWHTNCRKTWRNHVTLRTYVWTIYILYYIKSFVSNSNFTPYKVIFYSFCFCCCSCTTFRSSSLSFSAQKCIRFCMVCSRSSCFIYSKLVRKTIETVSVCLNSRELMTALVNLMTQLNSYMMHSIISIQNKF